MKKKYLQSSASLILVCLCCIIQSTIYSQSVSDILESGTVVKDKQAIFLRIQGDKLLYEVGKAPSDNFDPLKPVYFLTKGSGATVYLCPPLNPINYSSSSEINFLPDEVNVAAAKAISSIIEGLAKLTPTTATTTPPVPMPAKKKKKGAPENVIPVILKILIDSTCIKKFLKLIADFNSLSALLTNNKSKESVEIFTSLKSSGFTDKNVVAQELSNAKTKLEDIEKYLGRVKDLLSAIEVEIDEYKKCAPNPDPEAIENFVRVYVTEQMLNDGKTALNQYTKSFSNLEKVFTVFNKAYNDANGDGKNWYAQLGRVSMQDDKIASFRVAINTDGYQLTEENEITKSSKKELVTAELKFRKFNRFIPEVSAGIAYTKLSFPKFTTRTDAATGKQLVTNAGSDDFKKMNFTSMINFIYYVPNSSVHPFWQLGIGATAGYPTFFTGIGGRFNASLKRIAFSVGFAGTWIKSLSTLHIDSEVKDMAELEKDIIYEFSFPLKPYIGLQYNF